MQENIFGPLGMKDSGYDSNSAVIPRRAAGYEPGKDGPVNAGFIHMSIPFSAGALYSTTEDLLRWEQGLFGGKLLSAASLAKMTTPFKDDYAFGVGVRTAGGHKVIDHGGGIEGFNTFLAYYPEDKLTVVALGNLTGNAPQQIVTRLAQVVHGETVKLQSERKEITLDPKVLARYVGAYKMASGANMLITLENNQLMSKLGNQNAIPVFPEAQTMFFPKVVDAELEFTKDDDRGRPAEMILHQNGRDMPAQRLSDGEFQKIMDAAAAFAKRFKDQTAAPGSEAALRRMIGELQAGKPDYDQMSPGLAQATRQQLPQLQSTIVGLGTLESVKFTGVGPGGADIYQVKFEKGTLEYRIWLGLDGKVDSANVHPI